MNSDPYWTGRIRRFMFLLLFLISNKAHHKAKSYFFLTADNSNNFQNKGTILSKKKAKIFNKFKRYKKKVFLRVNETK